MVRLLTAGIALACVAGCYAGPDKYTDTAPEEESRAGDNNAKVLTDLVAGNDTAVATGAPGFAPGGADVPPLGSSKDGQAAGPGAGSGINEASMIGTYAQGGADPRSCASEMSLTLRADGTFSQPAGIRGRWSLSGQGATTVLVMTGELGTARWNVEQGANGVQFKVPQEQDNPFARCPG
jgi:hypothetical protein